MTDIKDYAIIKHLLATFAVKTAALNELLERYLDDKIPVPATSLLAFMHVSLSSLNADIRASLSTNAVVETAISMTVAQYIDFLLKKEDKTDPTAANKTLH